MLAYEDNFGFWEIHGSEEQEFFDYCTAPRRTHSLRALRTSGPAHYAENRLRFLRMCAGIWRAGFDERIWLQSENASGP
jgi:hypothetical protein